MRRQHFSDSRVDSIQVHYANGGFGKFDQEPAPEDEYFLGKIRLEAATGEDFSDVVSIPKQRGHSSLLTGRFGFVPSCRLFKVVCCWRWG